MVAVRTIPATNPDKKDSEEDNDDDVLHDLPMMVRIEMFDPQQK